MLIPLDQLPSCTPAIVVALPRGRGVAQRLIVLGIIPGAEVEVLQKWGHGPLIVRAHGARLALGRGEASRVLVEPLTAAECAQQDLAGSEAADAS